MTPQKRLSDEQRKKMRQLLLSASVHFIGEDYFINEIESIIYPDESKPLQAEAAREEPRLVELDKAVAQLDKSIKNKMAEVVLEKYKQIWLKSDIVPEHQFRVEALHEYAAQQVSIQTEAKDKEIERLQDELKQLRRLMDINKSHP